MAKFPFSKLLAELSLRLNTDSSPHILIDGIWFLNPFGGIARVWSSFFDFLSIPGILKPNQLSVICRSSFNFPSSHINFIKGVSCDPLDYHHILELSDEINDITLATGASVFCSSWTTFARNSKSFSQLALVHDCIPERYTSNVPLLHDVRRSWISNSDSFICVSSQTSSDLSLFHCVPDQLVQWAHPSSSAIFDSRDHNIKFLSYEWKDLLASSGLPSEFILLPGSSSLCSYKNPSVVGAALSLKSCSTLHLVVCGLSASQCVSELQSVYPSLRGRIHAAGFSDFQLLLAYRFALAVVVPSFFEGFGLPVIEIISSGGIPVIADSPGLIESGAEAALRFPSNSPEQLAALFSLVSHPPSRSLLFLRLSSRYLKRLSRIHPDLLPLAILTQARISQR